MLGQPHSCRATAAKIALGPIRQGEVQAISEFFEGQMSERN